MKQDIQKTVYQKRSKLAIKALKENEFEAYYADNSQKALDKVMSLISKGDKVGIGGSCTVREVGIEDALKKRGNTVYAHWGDLTVEEKVKQRKLALNSDVYLASSNAITLKGQLVNIDGTGNRVAAMVFGPKKSIIVAGANKIVDTLEEGFARIRTIASPLNATRQNLNTPCRTIGKCTDCNTPDNMCRVSVVVEKKPKGIDMIVIIVGENLGY